MCVRARVSVRARVRVLLHMHVRVRACVCVRVRVCGHVCKIAFKQSKGYISKIPLLSLSLSRIKKRLPLLGGGLLLATLSLHFYFDRRAWNFKHAAFHLQKW